MGKRFNASRREYDNVNDWGEIQGDISNQADLQTALDDKAADIHAHVAADITDFDAEVSNNVDVLANTTNRHMHLNKTELDLVTDGDHDIRTDNPHSVTRADLEVDYENIVTVAKSGGQFTTIQGAINSITDGSSSNRYVIQISPGTYTEAVTLKAGISLIGMGLLGDVVIKHTTGDTLTSGGVGTVTFIDNITIKSNPVSINSARAFVMAGAFALFNNVSFDIDITNSYMNCIELSSGTTIFQDCIFQYTQTGTGGGNHVFIRNSSTSVFNILGGYSTMNVAAIASTDYVMFIKDDGASISQKIVSSHVSDLTMSSASFVGEAIFWKTTGGTIENFCQGSHLHIQTVSGGVNSIGAAYDIDSAGSAGELHSSGNAIRVSGFNTNYLAEIIDATDSVTSHGDDVIAVDEYTGSGIIKYASSFSDGEFQISNKFRVGNSTNNITMGSDGTTILNGDARVLKVKEFHGRDLSVGTCSASTTQNFRVMRFDDTVNEDSSFNFVIPDDIDLSDTNPIIKIHLFPHTAQTVGSNCMFRLNLVRYVTNGEAIDKAFDETNLDTIINVDNVRRVTTSFEQVLDRTLMAVGDVVSMEIMRVATNAADDRNGDIDIFMVEFIYQSNKI